MPNKLGNGIRKLGEVVVYLFIISVFCFPFLQVSPNLPQIRFEEILLLFMLPVLWVYRQTWMDHLNKHLKTYLILIGGFIVWIFVTVIVNGRYGSIRDYFEVIKYVKYAIIILFFYLLTPHLNGKIVKVIYGASLFVLLFNFLHYFDVLGFNKHILPIFTDAERAAQFGLDSAGNPTYRRILGTMGNPNNNAVIISFFSFFYLLRLKKSFKEVVLFFLFFVLLLMTESRTALIAFVSVVSLYIVLLDRSWRNIWVFVVSLGVGSQLLKLLNLSYMSALWNIKLSNNTSFTGRLTFWDILIPMVKSSPIFGHGPNKEFFNETGLHAENELLLIVWRYGGVGVLLFLLLILIPFVVSFKNRLKIEARMFLLLSSFIFLTGVTNTPLAEPRIWAVYAMVIGMMFSTLRGNEGVLHEKKITIGRSKFNPFK